MLLYGCVHMYTVCLDDRLCLVTVSCSVSWQQYVCRVRVLCTCKRKVKEVYSC